MAIYLTITTLLTELQNNVRLKLGETGVYGDVTSRTAWLNLGNKAFIRDTWALSGNKNTSLLAIANQQEYDLWTIANYLAIEREGGILFDGRRINFKTIEQLYAEEGASWWGVTASNPQKCYLRGKRWLGLYPAPSVDYVGKTITVFYNKRPADMVNPTDTPFDNSPFLEEYTEAPLLWASWKMLMKGRQIDEAAIYAGLYEKMKNTCRLDLGTDEPTKLYFKPYIYNRNR